MSSDDSITRGRARLLPLAEARQLPSWREGGAQSAKDRRYDAIVAETLGFDCRALLVEDAEGLPLALQTCFFVEQDIAIAAPRTIRTLAGAVRRIFPRFLRLRILMLGSPAGEGRLDLEPLAIHALRDALPRIAREQRARLIVWKDFPASDRDHLAPLDCYARIASMPATRLALDFASFDEYLARRSHATRKNLRRKFKALATAPPLVMTVTNDLGNAADEALALYEQVFARSPLQFERLTKAFLQQFAAQMPDRVRFFLWRQEGRLVAFSLCLVHDGVLYDEYLGLDYRVALDLHLYFVSFRDVLTWALAQGLHTYRSTPLNYEPKLHLGFDLAPLDLYVALPWPAWNRLALPILRRMSPTRREPMLAEFSNAREMQPEAPVPRLLHPYVQLSLTVVLITISEILLKQGAAATAAGERDWLGLGSLAAPRVWLGAALLAASSVTWIFALRAMPLYLAFTLCSVIHVTIPVCSWLLLGDQISVVRWSGIALVLAGIWVIARPASRVEERA